MNDLDTYINYRLTKMSFKELRAMRKMTQEEVSKKSGLSKSTIHNIENDTGVSPSLRTLVIYLNAIDCELNVVDKK